MQESIDLGKSDEATAQVAQLGELAGELIGCGGARSATSLKSISFYRDWFHCSSPAAAGCQSTASRSHPPVPIDIDACPLARASPWSPFCFFVVSCFVFQQGRFATLGACLSRTPAIISPR